MTCSKLYVLHYVTPHITCIQVLGEDWMISDLIFVNCCCCSMPGPGAGAVPARTPEDGERLRLSASRLSLSDDEERRGHSQSLLLQLSTGHEAPGPPRPGSDQPGQTGPRPGGGQEEDCPDPGRSGAGRSLPDARTGNLAIWLTDCRLVIKVESLIDWCCLSSRHAAQSAWPGAVQSNCLNALFSERLQHYYHLVITIVTLLTGDWWGNQLVRTRSQAPRLRLGRGSVVGWIMEDWDLHWFPLERWLAVSRVRGLEDWISELRLHISFISNWNWLQIT